MKKLAMLTVKGTVGLIPKAVREKLKSNHKLTELYSRSLQRSGLFYGFPSEKKRMALYGAYLKQQEVELDSINLSSLDVKHICVIVFGDKKIQDTVNSLFQAGVDAQNIRIITAQRISHGLACFSTINTALATLSDSARVFFINSGDTVARKSLQVLVAGHKNAAIVYCDSDKLGKKNQRVSPFFLPDWNPDLQYSTGYVSTGVLIHTAVLQSANLLSTTIAGLLAELWIKNRTLSIRHVAYTLVHRNTDTRVWQAGLKDVRRVVESLTEATPSYNEELGVNYIQWP
ncbi:glycosyl transferase, partial [Alteromonas sp.]|nr:glycosyl transferase [Alteromonas sp.]